MEKNDKKICLILNFRDSVGVICWPKQEETLRATRRVLGKLGLKLTVSSS